jgi:hypothetical protein
VGRPGFAKGSFAGTSELRLVETSNDASIKGADEEVVDEKLSPDVYSACWNGGGTVFTIGLIVFFVVVILHAVPWIEVKRARGRRWRRRAKLHKWRGVEMFFESDGGWGRPRRGDTPPCAPTMRTNA